MRTGFRWCPVTWPSDSQDISEKPHRCQSRNWHLGAHRCSCDARFEFDRLAAPSPR